MAGEADELVVHRSGEAGIEYGEESGEAVHGMTRQSNQFGGTFRVGGGGPRRCFAAITECRDERHAPMRAFSRD
jgi:hypothetical protein